MLFSVVVQPIILIWTVAKIKARNIGGIAGNIGENKIWWLGPKSPWPCTQAIACFSTLHAKNAENMGWPGYEANCHCKNIDGFKFDGLVRDYHTYNICEYEILADFILAVAS